MCTCLQNSLVHVTAVVEVPLIVSGVTVGVQLPGAFKLVGTYVNTAVYWAPDTQTPDGGVTVRLGGPRTLTVWVRLSESGQLPVLVAVTPSLMETADV